MFVRLFSLCSLLLFGLARPAYAQTPPLVAAQLACPYCECARAQRDVETNRQELKSLKPQLRTRGPDIMMAAGGGGALASIVWPVATQLYYTGRIAVDGGSGSMQDLRRLWTVAGSVAAVHFAVLLAGMIWHRNMARDQAPARHRFRTLKTQAHSLRMYARDACGR